MSHDLHPDTPYEVGATCFLRDHAQIAETHPELPTLEALGEWIDLSLARLEVRFQDYVTRDSRSRSSARRS